MKMYDYDRRASTFNFTLGMNQQHDARGFLAAFTPLAKLFVDGRQLGLVSSFELKIAADAPWPQKFRVGVLESLSQADFVRCSPQLQRSARQVVSDLRRFPAIEVVCPEYLR